VKDRVAYLVRAVFGHAVPIHLPLDDIRSRLPVICTNAYILDPFACPPGGVSHAGEIC
jgi:hypothetical protein